MTDDMITLVQQVGDVEAQRGQDGIKHLELFTESGHQERQTRRSLEKTTGTSVYLTLG